MGLPLKSCGDDTAPLRRALVSGLFPNSARRQADGTYKVRGRARCLRHVTNVGARAWMCPSDGPSDGSVFTIHWLQLPPFLWLRFQWDAPSPPPPPPALQAQVIASGQQVFIHPSSVLVGKKADCVVFSELVLTTRQYVRDVTAVDARWLPELAPAFFAIKAGGGGGGAMPAGAAAANVGGSSHGRAARTGRL